MAKSPDEIVADIDRKQNEEDLDLPRRAYNKIKDVGGKAWDYAKTHSLKDVYDSMDQRSIADVVQGKAPIYKDVEKKAKGGKVKVSSASKRADGIAQRGKTKGKYL
jgi:hypothetical protein